MQQQQQSPNSGSSHVGLSAHRSNLVTTVFPVPGARAAGVSVPAPVISQPMSLSMSSEELERHQRSANGAGASNMYAYGTKKDEPKWSFGHGTEPAGQIGNPSASTARHPSPTVQLRNTGVSVEEDPVTAFLAEMPRQSEDPTRHALWTELVRLKTRSLELQIAEARQKEKEAELELLKLKNAAAEKTDNPPDIVHQTQSGQVSQGNIGGPSNSNSSTTMRSGSQGLQTNTIQNQHLPTFDPYPSVDQLGNQMFSTTSSSTQHLAPNPPAQQQPQSQPQQPQLHELDHMQNLFGLGQGQTALSPFDLEAMLQGNNLDNMLSWLPDLGDNQSTIPHSSTMTSQSTAPTTVFPSDLSLNTDTMPFGSDPSMVIQHSQPFTQYVDTTISASAPALAPVSGAVGATHSSPNRARSHSPAESSAQPPTKKTKRGLEKKTVIERSMTCMTCSNLLGRIMIRAPQSQIPKHISIQMYCLICRNINQPSTLPDSNNQGDNAIGTVETRKRLRSSLEIDDEDAKLVERRSWCDVCQRIVGSGRVVGGKDKESVTYMAEIICAACDSKYQRCTDCGGGGGPRVGIGKWRMRQVFHPGRKTCSLSHTRLGDRTRELGVHVTPTDFTPEQLKEVLTRCKALWNEKTLSRLAVPEMLEIDLPAHLSNPLRDFADIDDIVTRNWPSREAMIRADGVDPMRFKRLLGLIWAHSKPRRSVKTVDLEEEWTKQPEDGDDDDMSTVLANVKRTNVVIPPGSELIGMWGSEWNMLNGSLLISTFIPFEGADGEDSTALSVGEMITRVQSLQQDINADRIKQGKGQAELLPPCEHLWTVSGGYIPLVRERFADILIRKRAFVHVEEYLTRHPEFIDSIRARPVGLHPDIHRPLPLTEDSKQKQEEQPPRPLILVRWLGKEFDAQKILEIKQMEFGGGAKKKRAKGRV